MQIINAERPKALRINLLIRRGKPLAASRNFQLFIPKTSWFFRFHPSCQKFFVLLQTEKKGENMTTVTIDYDEKNLVIDKLLEAIVALGAKLHVSELDQALMEVESGDVIKCDSFEDYLAKMNA